MLICTDVYRPLHGADNRTIKVLFCGGTCFAAVRRSNQCLRTGQGTLFVTINLIEIIF